METKNLFSAIKTFINNTPVGQTFTTKQLIGVVGSNETLTRWKAVNSNPFYRTHTYKAYLRRTGFLSFIRRGEWKVEKHIPESYNLGTIEFLIGYKGETYNGMTREEILNPKPTSLQLGPLKVGDILEFNDGGNAYKAKKGAKAIYKGRYIGHGDEEYIKVEWIRDELSDSQSDGGYYESQFTKVEEVSTQKEDRILDEIKKEKVMKNLRFNFEEGKQRVIAMMSERVDNFTHDMLQDIRLVINEDRDETLDQIEGIIESIRYTKRNTENATERVKSAIYIREVLEAMENTMFEEMEETVLGELFGVDIIID
jgi:hypothetical protein